MSHRDPRVRFDRYWVPEPNTGCRLWIGWMKRDGYGRFSMGRMNRCLLAHRVAWMFEHGDPAGSLVLHRCDVRACVHPAHLFLGSNDANMADMVAKQRQAWGERNGQAKLRAEDVRDARAAVVTGETQTSIAQRMRVDQSTISRLLSNETWRGLP